ncbi:MAG: transaldolase family protein [Planctomycetota bacterium]|jgi:transaldolase
MSVTDFGSDLASRVRDFVLESFRPKHGELDETFPSVPLWGALSAVGSALWLDSGDTEAITGLWAREFTALTTNNTLLNREVQKGTYDDAIPRAARLLDGFGDLSGEQRTLEMAFILNALHGLHLVETFDAFVSVEEHTDLAGDMEGSVNYARRYREICPERFYVKIPLTPAGLLATRLLSADGIPVNLTLGFSARQNYLAARVVRPAFVNVFMGRLNSFTADNDLGDGAFVGEKATLASQRALRRLRSQFGIETRQIGASFREGGQVRDLAGIDVMTIPPAVAREFLDLGLDEGDLEDRSGADYRPVFGEGIDERAVGFHTLWELDERLGECLDALERENIDAFAPADLTAFLADRGFGDLLVNWTGEEVALSAREGKIPKLANWRDALASGRIGLDALMNLAGWNSFSADQDAMDKRVRDVLAGK